MKNDKGEWEFIYNDDKYEDGSLKVNDNTISWQENKSHDDKSG